MKQKLLLGIAGLMMSMAVGMVGVATFVAVSVLDTQMVQAQDDIDDEGGEGEQKSGENLLVWTFKSLGLTFSIVFLIISFLLVALTFKYALALRRTQNIPQGLDVQFEELLNQRQFQQAYEMTKNDDSYLGQVLSAGLAKLASGYDKSVQAMQETSDNISMTFEHGLSYIGMIAGTSTMLGLLGTVSGMIQSFKVIAQATTAPKPNELAGGISTAMFTTLVGLVIAIPAIVIFQIFKNKLARTVFEVGTISEDLLGKVLASVSKK